MDIIRFSISCFYFFLPAYFSNMTPPIAKKLNLFPSLDKPIDFNKKLFGKPILGGHKTWRGAILALMIGLIFSLLQRFLFQFQFFQRISIIDYSRINIFLFGLLISLGEIMGDLFFAFIKRRLNLPPGAPFIPFDQINYVVGAFLFLYPVYKIDLSIWAFLLFSTFFLHIFVNRLGYLLKIHSARW